MGEKPIVRRRRYFLREGSQPRLILGIQLIYFALLLIGGAIFYYVTQRDLGETYFSAHVTVKNVSEILLPTLIGMNLLGIVISIAASVFFTHRIAGPAFSLARMLRGVGQGDLSATVHFRKNDELKELNQASNEMIDGLNNRLGIIKEGASRVGRVAGEAGVVLRGGEASRDGGRMAEELEAEVASLVQSLEHFKLRGQRGP